MDLRQHEVEQRWRLWMKLHATADALRELALHWANVDPQLRHYIWLHKQADEHPNGPDPRSTRS